MTPMTLGKWLLVNAQFAEMQAAPVEYIPPATYIDNEYCPPGADIHKQIKLDHITAWYGPGMADLRAIAESEGEEEGVSVPWVRRRRGDLIRHRGYTATTADDLTMPQLADALKAPLPPPVANSGADKTDKKTDNEIKEPPDDVRECIDYIKRERAKIACGNRKKASKKALIREYVNELDAPAMERALQPSRFGKWLDRTDN